MAGGGDMIKTLWCKLKHCFDPYYELSPEEIERLIVVKERYTDALACLYMANYSISEQIRYLNEKIAAIDEALGYYTDKEKDSDLSF